MDGVGCSGHHGIDVSYGASNLVTRFDFQTRFVHDISVEWFALGTVFADGKGQDLNLDMHRCCGPTHVSSLQGLRASGYDPRPPFRVRSERNGRVFRLGLGFRDMAEAFIPVSIANLSHHHVCA